MENILKDSTTFEPLTDTERNQVYLNIKKDINRLKKSKIITEDEHKAFISNTDSEAHIYGKPKLHKQNIPLRPIVAFYLSPIAPIAKFLTKFLQPLIRTHTPTQSIANIPTFIQEILNTNIENHHLIVSFDVEALYPSLPHQLILENTKSLLIENRLDQTVINKIIELIDLSLKSNIFNFNSQSFKQIKGSPMGSPLSSPLAVIVMNTIDKWITTQFPTDIIIYKRYIDDIFCICTANKVNHILTSLNNYYPRIKFTIEVEKKNNKLPFLDINIIRSQNRLQTSVYYKPSFEPNYIHFTSYCPLSHKINTIKTLTKRIHTHCSQQNSKMIETQNIINNLQQAGYPTTFILKHFHKSITINNPINKTTDIYRAICYIPYSQTSITIANLLKKLRHPNTLQNVEPESDNFEVIVTDGQHNSSVAKMLVTIILRNDEEPQVSLLDLSVLEGGIVSLGENVLRVTDADFPADRLVVSVALPPQHGVLSKLVTLEDGSQAELPLESEDLHHFLRTAVYHHDGSENFQDELKLEVTDGLHPRTATARVTVVPVNDQPPRVVVNRGLSGVAPGGAALISPRYLLAADADRPPDKLVFRVMSPPVAGRLEHRTADTVWLPLLAPVFSQQQLEDNLV
ncbi:hypothetical protein LAZ67_17001880, partial [Cordylochernes scorpioides]